MKGCRSVSGHSGPGKPSAWQIYEFTTEINPAATARDVLLGSGRHDTGSLQQLQRLQFL